MKKQVAGICAVLFVVATLSLSGYAQEKELQWAAAPIQIDGLDQEWQDAVFMVDKKSKAEYAMRNDGKNLYILFVFKDPKARSTIDLSGLTIYYNLEGKKKKSDGVHFFRKQVTADELIGSLEVQGEVLTEEQKAEIRKRPGYVLFEADILGSNAGAAPADSGVAVDKPTFRSQNKEKVGIFEFRLPLIRTAKNPGVGAEPGQAVKLFFEWGGMTSEMRSAQMARAAESGSQASGRATTIESALSGGDERIDSGGGGGMGGMRRDPNAQKHSFWVDVKLAKSGQ